MVTQLGECVTEDHEVAGSSPAHGTISSTSTSGSPSMEPDRIFIDFKQEKLTMMEVMTKVAELQKEYPEYEIFMDGDAYAIVGRRRKERWEGEG